MQLPDLHCAIDQLINHVLIPWHDERAAVQPRISLHQPFYHSIWSLFGPPFVCLPCVVTFLSLCPKYTNEQLCVMYTEIQSLKNSNNTKHIEERIRRFCSGSVSKSG